MARLIHRRGGPDPDPATHTWEVQICSVCSRRNDVNDSTRPQVQPTPAPTGPFAAGRTLAKLPSNTATGELRYMPLAHPDLVPEKGTMVVSYSRNNTDTGAVEKNPLLYRPQFMRVDLP